MLLAFVVAALAAAAVPERALAASAAEIDRDATAALRSLYASQPSARLLAGKAKAVLVFPHMLKAGFMFGGQIGEGAMRKGNLVKGGRTTGYYNSVAASYGFRGHPGVLLRHFPDDRRGADRPRQYGRLRDRRRSERGAARPGRAKSLTTTTLTEDAYAFIWGQMGLMAGLGIQGSKITRIEK
jgi:lipid-binding SYLF domain-containing protein